MKTRNLLLVGLCALAAACTTTTSEKPLAVEQIKLNQVGYYPFQEKVAVLDNCEADEFAIIDAVTQQKILVGKPQKNNACEWSDKARYTLDFSQLTMPGKYKIEVGDMVMPFEIKKEVWKPVADAALKAFYYQRTGMPIEEQYAGKWHRPMGHPDDKAMIHPNAASKSRPAGTIISSPKGWYDAGDYNKYIVNSGFSIGLMQAIYIYFPEYFAKQNVNIPESGNSTPDFLDEMHYNLDWMLTMQDPADGGVYHKLTTPSFEGFIMPADCKQQRYAVFKSVTAALDFAAVMAQSAGIFANYETDYPGFAKKAVEAAEKAYAWAQKNPNAFYHQELLNKQFEPAVVTGAYGDGSAKDEFFWAASELYWATGKEMYGKEALKYAPETFTTPSWGNVASLGAFAWMKPDSKLDDKALVELAEKQWQNLQNYCEEAIKGADNNAFHAPYGDSPRDFFWGCLAEGGCNQAISLIVGYGLTGKKAYLQNAYRNADYILGRNATGYCYVTGFGVKSPMYPHHRLSGADSIEEPLPGFLVGGPNPGQQDKNDGAVYTTNLPDESYADVQESYASNEIAINWNAALVAMISALDALAQ